MKNNDTEFDVRAAAAVVEKYRKLAGTNEKGCWLHHRRVPAAAVTFQKRRTTLHRLTLGMILGRWLDAHERARHTCDEGHSGCFSPFHLVVGSAADNAVDTSERGRRAKSTTRWFKGEHKGNDTLWGRAQWFIDRAEADEHGCLIPTARMNRNGYHEFNYKNKTYRLHRIALEIQLGRKLEEWEVARHTCDRPGCILHLESGAAADNVRDMMERGRKVVAASRLARLPEDRAEAIVLDIRNDNISTIRQLADRHGVASGVVWNIKIGKSYREFGGPIKDVRSREDRFLQDGDIREILLSALSKEELGEKYDLLPRYIRMIQTGSAMAHRVPDVPRHPKRTRATRDQAIAIRGSDEPAEIVAERFGLSVQSVNRIRKSDSHGLAAPRA